MNIEDRVVKAYDLHHQGYNCAQAVFGSYIDLFDDLDFDQAMTISYGFGGGLGMTREICGTLTGAAMLLGLKYGKGQADVEHKKFVNQKVNELCQEFEIDSGSLVCGELLGLRKTSKVINGKSCDELIEIVVRKLEKYMAE